MNAVRAMLKDRRRSQRGSVLSGVLIMTAFIAIISGALMTELSTGFVLAHVSDNRMANQATINSALEVTMNQLATTPISGGCPSLNAVNLNNRWAVPIYTSCWPTVRESPDHVALVGASAQFTVDGTYSAVITTTGQRYDIYLVGNSAGQLYQFDFMSSARLLTTLPGGTSGPPVAFPELTCCNNEIVTLVPISVPSNPPPGCPSGSCVAFVGQDGIGPPDSQCFLGANGPVTARPAEGVGNPGVYFFGDHTGTLFAYTASEGGGCVFEASASTSGGKPIVAGPVVYRNPNQSSTDEVYVVAGDGGGSSLVRFEYIRGKKSTTLTRVASQALPLEQAVGMAVDGTPLPARVAVTFNDGTVALAQIYSDFSMSAPVSTFLGNGIAGAPGWCCGSSPTRIGVAQSNGLSVLDTSLNLVGFYAAAASIAGSPVADAGGDWFFGANDGNVYEVPDIAPAPTVIKLGSAQLGRIQSSIALGPCPAGMCIFASSRDQTVYQIAFDARQAVITACIATSSSLPCSGATPLLHSEIEVGSSASKNSVHVQGWSYYSG